MRSTDRDQTVASTQSLMLPTAGLKNMALTPLPPPEPGYRFRSRSVYFGLPLQGGRRQCHSIFTVADLQLYWKSHTALLEDRIRKEKTNGAFALRTGD